MSWKKFGSAGLAAALLGSLAACSTSGGSTTPATGGATKDAKQVKIGFAQQTLLAPYYVAMQKEAQRMAKEKGFSLVFQAANGDPVQQVNQVQTMVSQGVDVIVVNAVSPGTEKEQLTAIAKKKPLMFIDTSIPGVGFTTVQSDNLKIGAGAGELMAKRIGAGKTINLAILNGGPRDEIVGPDRRKGFLDGLKKGGVNYKIVGEANANYTQDLAVTASENLLAAHPDIDVIFGYNDSMSLGALKTLKTKKNTRVLVAGVDGQKEALAEISKGGCSGQYVSTGLNSPTLAAKDVFDIALKVATGQANPGSFPKVSFTKAVGIGCNNIKEYYDPNSTF
jgi:ABC-type sugar transport system substrate-binding protein